MTSRSKFGVAYPMADIRAAAPRYAAELLAMRKVGGNRFCADCGRKRSTWAAISATERRGVFVCIDCAQVHRCAGTHVSRVKNCLGTYLWHPDEMEAMRAGGNEWAAQHYGCSAVLDRAGKTVSQQEALPLVLAKYTGPRPAKPPPETRIEQEDNRQKARKAAKARKKRAQKTKEKHAVENPEEEKTPPSPAAAAAAAAATADFFEAMLATPAPGTIGRTPTRFAPMNFEDWLKQ